MVFRLYNIKSDKSNCIANPILSFKILAMHTDGVGWATYMLDTAQRVACFIYMDSAELVPASRVLGRNSGERFYVTCIHDLHAICIYTYVYRYSAIIKHTVNN